MWTSNPNAIQIPQEPFIAPSDDGLLDLSQVKRITTLSKTVIYREMRKGAFPRPITVGAGSARWLRTELRDYLMQRVTERYAAEQK